MPKIPEIKNTKHLSLDFIAGFITDKGYFSWVTYKKNKQKVAIFQLQMSYKDKDLIFAIKNSLGLKESIYEYKYQDKNKPLLSRHYIKLLVRRRETIKKIIIPTFEGRLHGLKQKQFNQWKQEFYEQEKKWKYNYIDRIKILDKNFGPRLMDIEKL